MSPGDFAVAIERDEVHSVVLVPFDGNVTEHALEAGRSLADLIDRAFPGESADQVIAAIVEARMADYVDADEVEDPGGLTPGESADVSPLCLALIHALDELDVGIKFYDAGT